MATIGTSSAGSLEPRGAGHGGFTLLELIVVLVILAMTVTLVPPLFRAAVPSARLKAAAQELAGSLRLVRSHAVSRGTRAELSLDPASRTYTHSASRRPRSLPSGVEVAAGSERRPTGPSAPLVFTFFPDGSSLGGSVRLSVGDRGYHVDVDPVRGAVSIRPAG